MPWLPPVGREFRENVRSLREALEFDPAKARWLSNGRLDISQLHSLARALAKQTNVEGDARVSLSILSNSTADLLVPSVVATAPRHGLWIDAVAPAFGTFATEALDANSQTNKRGDDFVLLALDHRCLNFLTCPGEQLKAEEIVASAVSQVQKFITAISGAGRSTIIVQTLAPPATTMFGSLDAQTPGTLRSLIEHFNIKLREVAPPETLILDVASLAEIVGLGEWHDPVQWNLGKFSFSQRAVPLYAEWLCRLIAASKGKSRKCLVLDLDNTLWGGVIGDDGLHGVVLGQGSPVGEAYLAIQKTALMLRDRGIILAVSSKNDDETARKMFREHPEMLLREDHIAVFQANWQDKASNLCAIAESLNIGIDSLVLLDDNPAERQQVRLALPQVAVPELPEHPDLFSEILLSAGYFETTQFTLDDRQRANHYTANTARRAVLGVGTDLEDYLKSLEMEAHVSPFDEVGRSRITQLINKTNQFNLTTRRYTYSDVAQFESDPSIVDLQVRLKDRYGDNGMICVVICKVSNQDLIIDTWLMSCRVLNRRVEDMILNLLIGIAKKRKLVRIIGTYYPTDRNRIVSDLYARLGFQNQIELSDLGQWHFTVSEHTVSNVPIKIRLSENIEIDKTAAGMDR